MAILAAIIRQSIWGESLNKLLKQTAFLFSQVMTKEKPIGLENEKELIKQAQQGNEDSFTELYNHYFPRVYGFVIKRCGHQQTAEDITSQVFLKAFAKLPKFVYQGAPFGAWVFKIASNALIDYYRKASTNRERVVETLPEHPEDLTHVHEDMLSAESKEEVLRLVARLGKKDQEVIHLKFFAELSVQEISAMLEVSPNNISVRIFRAVKKLQKITQSAS